MKLSCSELKFKANQNFEVYLRHRANNDRAANRDEMCSYEYNDTGKRLITSNSS